MFYLDSVRTQTAGSGALSARILSGVASDPINPGYQNTALAAKIESGLANIQNLAASGSVDTSQISTATTTETKTYVRSEYADGNNILIGKTYTDKNGGTLQSGDRVLVSIQITNSGSSALSGISYLDSYDKTVFQADDTLTYTKIGTR